MLSTLFYHPIDLPFKIVLWFILPLCFAVALVYKTVRCEKESMIVGQVTFLMLYILSGLIGVSIVLWLIHTYWPVS